MALLIKNGGYAFLMRLDFTPIRFVILLKCKILIIAT